MIPQRVQSKLPALSTLKTRVLQQLTSSKKLWESLWNKVLVSSPFTLIVVSPLSISKENASKVKVLIDSRLSSSSNLLAFHPSDASKTVFVTAQELKDYLNSCGADITEFDFGVTAT